jgi:hypothetical protein
VDETEAKFQLLLREMEAIQDGIQSMDSAMFKIKGWCITVAASATGVAITFSRPSFVFIGLWSTLAFWFVDAYFKSIQRIYIERDLELCRRLVGKDPSAVLNDRPDTGVWVPDLARRFQRPANTRPKVLWMELTGTLQEAWKPVVGMLYLFVIAGLGIALLILEL